MRRLVLGLMIVTAACGVASPPGDAGTIITSTTTTTTVAVETEPTPGMMAAAVETLITRDHTFGAGPPPFTTYLIQSRTDPAAGDPTGAGGAARPLTDSERAAIEAVVEPFGDVRWIDDPAEWRTTQLEPTIEGAVILGVGEPSVDGGLVPVSLWCGGLCGTWLTYRVEQTDGGWAVTGTEGPVAIS
jgi:hypothetical protein